MMPGSPSFLRRVITVTRTVVVNGSACSSQTRSRSSSLLTTDPLAPSSTSSTPNALRVSSTGSPARATVRRAAIEHHHVVPGDRGLLVDAVPVVGDVDLHALPAQPPGQGVGQRPLVLHDQHPHPDKPRTTPEPPVTRAPPARPRPHTPGR